MTYEVEQPYAETTGAYAVYGLVANGASGHTLCFLGQTDDPEALFAEHEEYPATLAYRVGTARQFEPGEREPGIILHHGLPPREPVA
jgi:hypothetical protein